MVCDCVADLNQALAEQGLCISMPIVFHDSTLFQVPFIALESVDGRKLKCGTPKSIMCHYCQFCGRKIDLDECADHVRKQGVN